MFGMGLRECPYCKSEKDPDAVVCARCDANSVFSRSGCSSKGCGCGCGLVLLIGGILSLGLYGLDLITAGNIVGALAGFGGTLLLVALLIYVAGADSLWWERD